MSSAKTSAKSVFAPFLIRFRRFFENAAFRMFDESMHYVSAPFRGRQKTVKTAKTVR